jgi:DNA helicase-2/ATP-dependent DNA helicase PcrA
MTDITPADLKEILGLSFAPVEEQSNVIDLSKDGVHLVLAGAGSGKTETMSLRALWLVAIQGVRPEQVLGLTFTRKAARELSERFRQRIALVRANRSKFAELGISVDHLADDDHGFSTPTVSTYNAFASEIFTEHAARIGWDSDSPVITEATAFAIAREVVTSSTDTRLGEYGFSLNTVVDGVIRLASELGEFDITDDDAILDYARRVAALKDLPGKTTQAMNTFREKFAVVGALDAVLPLAREFIAEKKRRGVVEFSDQVTFARRILRDCPDVAQAYRDRFAVVILDEYQDTSYAQTSLFAQLFGPARVTAVGDPNQSIYGWRGASPANVASFHSDFDSETAATAEVSTLATSWRNGTKILSAANTILRHRSAANPLDVGQLQSYPGASEFDIDAVFAASTSAEARQLADWFLTHLDADRSGRKPTEPVPTMAMLIQTRTHLDAFLKEFDAKKVPYRLLGVAGILGNPFIADLFCALSVIAEPGKGSRLVRLLGGARWQISVSDLWALHNHARNVAKSYTTREQRSRLGSSLVEDEADSLIDALDSLRYTARENVETTNQYDKPVVFSDEGWVNLVDAAEFFHDLRRHVELSVPDVVNLTATALQLDIEGIASLHHSPGAYREAFDDLVHAYLAIPTTQSLRGFVAWVSEVERLERMTPRSDEPEPGVVQILTVHAAKGLEWDVVALPRWTQPPRPADGKLRGDKSKSANEMGWLNLGSLPHHFRPDSRHLPVFDWQSASTIDELLIESEAYTERLKTQLILPEERRLMYVAVTRARHRLWISGAHYEGKGKTSKIPSTYWEELVEAKLIRDDAVQPIPDSNPDGDGGQVVWPPLDPLGTPKHRAAYDAAAALIESSTDPVDPADLRAIEQLLAHETLGKADIPVRIPASRYAEWSMDLASVREGNRRPIPTRPYRAARLGTEVHLWIERGAIDDDFVDGWDEANDLPETDEAMRALKDAYLASRWPHLTPAHTELEILLPRGRHIIVCKIDAVYQIDGRWVVVDWKTGAKPTEEQKDAKALQLVLYRRALAEWLGTDMSNVDAVLYYIAHDWEWTIERERLDRLDALPPID